MFSARQSTFEQVFSRRSSQQGLQQNSVKDLVALRRSKWSNSVLCSLDSSSCALHRSMCPYDETRRPAAEAKIDPRTEVVFGPIHTCQIILILYLISTNFYSTTKLVTFRCHQSTGKAASEIYESVKYSFVRCIACQTLQSVMADKLQYNMEEDFNSQRLQHESLPG